MVYLDILFVLIAVILLTPVLVIFVQVMFACLPLAIKSMKPTKHNFSNDSNIAVLVPAHNESVGIISTLKSIKSQLKPNDRMVVIADNCTDDTAKVAAEHGAEVIERVDAVKRGKGYALDFGVRHLSQRPPHVVIIIDADCTLRDNSIRALVDFTLESNRPIQALDLMYAKSTDLKTRVSEFAWCVKNWVRPLGFAKLGLPCQLMGTGMAFPWALISEADLANGSIVEDMKLGIELAMAGKPPVFFLGSQVSSYFPEVSEVQTGQRTRWEHGHLAMILSEAPKLFLQGMLKGDKNLLAMALDLSVPPLALLVALIFGFATMTGVLMMMYHVGQVAFQIVFLAMIFLIVAIGVAWIGWGRNIISLSAMMLVPVYVMSKIPHYVKFLFKRQKTWIKTKRD